MKEFKFKFDIGDAVYAIIFSQKRELVKCEACNGKGEIPLLNGETSFCPKCHGRDGGRVAKCHPKRWRVGEILTIGQQRVEIESNKVEEVYMCNETGIGAGTLHPVETLFLSKSNAEKECRSLNKKEG